MAALARPSSSPVGSCALAGLLAVSWGCSEPSSQSGDTASSTSGSAGQPTGVGVGGQETSDSSGGDAAGVGGRIDPDAGLGGLGSGGRVPGSGGVTALGGTTGTGGQAVSGGTAGSGGTVGSGGDTSRAGSTGSGGTTGIGGGAGLGGETLSGGTGGGLGGDAGNAGASGSGAASNLGGAAGAGADAGTGGTGTGGNGACVPAPGPCTKTSYHAASGTSSTITYFYDDLDRLVRTESDYEPPEIIRYSYDEAGRLIEEESDACALGGTGQVSGYCIRYVYTYDDQGNLTLENNASSLPSVVTGCTEYTYDENGLRLTASYYEWCSRNGVPDEYTTYEYDADGRLVVTHQFGASPTGPSADITLEYDATGRVVTKTETDAHGNVTGTTHYTRNAAGQPLLILRESTELDDYQMTYTYDEQGNELTRRILDLEGETEGEERSCYVKTYDDCGNELTLDSFPDCGEQASNTTTQTYGCFLE